MRKNGTTPQLRPGDPGYVGRGHPPEHGKIRKGERRNPWGRKGKKGHGAKPAPLDFAQEVSELLSQPVRSKDGKLYSRTEFAVHSLTKGITEGKIAHLKLFFEISSKYQQRASLAEDKEMDAADQAILTDYGRQLLLSYGIDPDAAPAALAVDNGRSEGEQIDAGEEVDHV